MNGNNEATGQVTDIRGRVLVVAVNRRHVKLNTTVNVRGKHVATTVDLRGRKLATHGVATAGAVDLRGRMLSVRHNLHEGIVLREE